jgi:hypothetical protein
MNLQNKARRLASISEKFEKTFGTLSDEQLNLRPAPDKWSIAQNIEHLIIINESYYPIFSALHDGSFKVHFLGKIPFLVKFFGNTLLKHISDRNKSRMKTFPIWEPSQSNVPAGILKRFLAQQTEFSEKMLSCETFVENKTVIASPANEKIVYYLETAFDIIIAHEERHFEQANDVLTFIASNR